MKHLKLWPAVLLLWVCTAATAQPAWHITSENRQQSFAQTVPAGGYSGISRMQGNEYLVVSDAAPGDGFFVFRIDIDSISGEIISARSEGFRPSGMPNGDMEGIAWHAATGTVFVGSEKTNDIFEYALDGKRTIRQMNMPECFRHATANYGLESLAYNGQTATFWTCNESTLPTDGEQATSTNGVRNKIRLQAFDERLQPTHQYAYLMDSPVARKAMEHYAMGVSELCALDDGRLIVMEREFAVPAMKLGAYVVNKLYLVDTADAVDVAGVDSLRDDAPFVRKELLTEWKTRLTLFNHEIANYEGMCLGPTLKDGSQVILLISDSQMQYAGVLKDWLKTVCIHRK